MTLKAIVLDIEGTTSSTRYVHETLYPYSRERFRPWITAHLDQPEVQAQIEAVRALANEPEADLERVLWWLDHWLGGDEKITPLKAFQGWIWSEGFAAGDLVSHFFDDSIPAIKAWHAAGFRLSIFSSGSVSAQHAWFGHSPQGSLLPLFVHDFDTENLGPKKSSSSYELIAKTIGVEPGSIVFLSDLVLELHAARKAGWHTIGVRRKGDQYYNDGVGDHPAVHSFDEIDFSAPAPFLLQAST